jgi:hypothetical protein
MKSFSSFIKELNEHYVNIFPGQSDSKNKQNLEKHSSTINKQIDDSYSKIGGFLGSRKFQMHKVVTRNGDIVAGAAYKGLDKGKRKLSVIHHNGTKEGKAEVAKIVSDDLKTGRAIHHISGDMIGFTNKTLAKRKEDLSKYALPVHKVKKLFPDEEIGKADPNHPDVKANPHLPWFTTKIGPKGQEETIHKIALSGAPEHHKN